MIRPSTLVRSDSEIDQVPMQAPASNIREDEMDCGIANIPCCFGQRARCQQMATPGRFLFIFILLGVLMSIVEGYVYASAKLLTNTFKFPPSLFDYLIAANGLFQGIIAISIAHWGKRIHRTAWLGGLTCLLGAFCFISIIPYVNPSEGHRNSTAIVGPRLCAREMEQLTQPEEETAVVMMLVLVALLAFLSMGNVSYWSHGLTYLDDNVDSVKTPNFIGMLLGLRITMVKNGYTVLSFVSGSPQLWWIPFLIFGILLIIIGSAIACFPLKMLSTIVKQTAASILDIASGNSHENLEELQTKKKTEEFWPTLKRIITNKIIVIDTLALSVFAMGVCHFDTYENAYLQAQYHIPYTDDFVDPWTSRKLGDIFKTVMIILLTLVAGLIFAKVQPSAKKMASFIFMMGIHTVIIFVAFIFLDCKTSSIVGEEGSRYMTPLCSHDCMCRSSEVVFEPVCIIEGSQTYFSPCHAGCTTSAQFNNIFIYGNCTCGPNPEFLLGSGPLTSATRGACSASNCFGQWTTFQVFYVLNIAFASSTLVAHLLIALRCVRASDKATAVGFMLAGVGIIVYFPGHFIYKLISDSTCHYWNADGYNCNLHGSSFADILAGVTAGLVAISCVLSFFVLRLCRNFQIYEDDEKPPISPDYPLDETSSDIEEVQAINRPERTDEDMNMYRPVFRTTQI